MRDLGEKALTAMMIVLFVCLALCFVAAVPLVLRAMWRAW